MENSIPNIDNNDDESYYALFLMGLYNSPSSSSSSSLKTTKLSSFGKLIPSIFRSKSMLLSSSSSLSSSSLPPSASVSPPLPPSALSSSSLLTHIDEFWSYTNTSQAERWSGLHISLSDFAGKCDSNCHVKHDSNLINAVLPEIRSALYGNNDTSNLIPYIFSDNDIKSMKLIRLPSNVIAIDFNIDNITLDKICHVIYRNGVYGVMKQHEGNKKDGLTHRLHGVREKLHMSLGNINDIEFIKRLVNLNINPITDLPLAPTKSSLTGSLTLQSASLPEQLRESLRNFNWELSVVKWNNIKEDKKVDSITCKELLMKIKK